MSDSDDTVPPSPRKGSKGMIVTTLVLLLVGAGAGFKLIGPMLKGGTAKSALEEQTAETPVNVAPEMVRMDNVIINPRGSMGSRVLILSVAFEVGDKAAKEALTYKEVPLRDAIITALEEETVESLGRPGAREELKDVLKKIAQGFAPKAKITVFIPQFLLQ